MKETDILILGAGCAGTSLAHYLEEFGYDGRVVLLDSRKDFNREQRWCTWSKLPASLSTLVQKSWPNWTVCDKNHSITKTSKEYSYKQIYAPDFFSHFHSRWQSLQTPIEMNLGERVERIEDKMDFVEVQTEHETWRAKLVFDARHQGSANFKLAIKKNSVYLHQTFVGLTVEFPEPVFDSETATIMDFRTAQSSEVNFIYVLPYSDREALVESTSFGQNKMIWDEHTHAVKRYVAENFGNDYKIKAKESGELPMTTANFPGRLSSRVYAIGVGGGSARPSSGYAFHRIQRQTSKIARSVVEGRAIPTTHAPRIFDLLDAVFLESIVNNPHAAKDFFIRIFEGVKSDSIIRFLLDESSIKDDLAVIWSLPKMPLGLATIQSLLRKFTTRDKTNDGFQAAHDTLCRSMDKSSHGLVARSVGRAKI